MEDIQWYLGHNDEAITRTYILNKFVDEFLVYPPSEKISEMSLEEQEAFFKKELQAIQNYFTDIIILSANVHLDEAFHPKDEERKVTPHMHVIAYL